MLLLSWAINKIGLEQWRYDKLGSCQEQTKVESDHLIRLLKSSIFAYRKLQKSGIEFCRKSIGATRCSIDTSYNDV